MSWTAGPLAVFDLETTAPDPLAARIVTSCVSVNLRDGAGARTQQCVADPGVPIPDAAAAIHGYTTERARAEGQPAAEVVQLLARDLTEAWDAGCVVIGHNVRYDLTVLTCDAARHRVPFSVTGPVADTLVLDKHADPYRRGKRTLTATAAHYGVPLLDAHDARADAIAAGRIALAIAARYPDLAALTAPDLHAAQIGWASEQAESLQAYFRRKDPDADPVDGAWPVYAIPEELLTP